MNILVAGLAGVVVLLIVALLDRRRNRPRLRILLTLEGVTIMAQAISIVDTHAPLQLSVVYVNAKGKVVPGPASPTFNWTLTDTNTVPVASQSPAGAADVVTPTGADGAFTVSVTDGTFNDSLPVTVTPDQTVAGIAIQVANQ